MSELKEKLAALDERRSVAERELDKLTSHQDRIESLRREGEALMERYHQQAMQGLDLFTPQRANRVTTLVLALPNAFRRAKSSDSRVVMG
jgi:hypothetical protein